MKRVSKCFWISKCFGVPVWNTYIMGAQHLRIAYGQHKTYMYFYLKSHFVCFWVVLVTF